MNKDRSRRGQPPLITTPLLVTMVVSVKYSRRELPRERAKLYDACVDVVLNSEYTGREDDAGARRGVVTAGGPPDKQRQWLSLLAFEMHQGGQAGASDEPGPEKATCPVVNVTWHDARAYCVWLTEIWRDEGKIAANEQVRLSTEAEWEKAARGTGGEIYPWGNNWDEKKCNTGELDLRGTTPVGIFPDGASPYGCLDMAGNVFEWTLSLWGPWKDNKAILEFGYPYDPTDGRENVEADDNVLRVLRGGSFNGSRRLARCASRDGLNPISRDDYFGIRVVVSPISLPSAL